LQQLSVRQGTVVRILKVVCIHAALLVRHAGQNLLHYTGINFRSGISGDSDDGGDISLLRALVESGLMLLRVGVVNGIPAWTSSLNPYSSIPSGSGAVIGIERDHPLSIGTAIVKFRLVPIGTNIDINPRLEGFSFAYWTMYRMLGLEVWRMFARSLPAPKRRPTTTKDAYQDS
jgi:hypothetical protein